MSRNWEQHYSKVNDVDLTPAELLVEAVETLPLGRALDLACGTGRNAIYLASLGWDVVAVDSAYSAIRILREHAAANNLRLETHVENLETGEFRIGTEFYDLICDFFFLQRDLFPAIREGVRVGGCFVAEIHLRDNDRHQFVLEPGELRAEFAEWKILYYSEGARPCHARPTARIIARKA